MTCLHNHDQILEFLRKIFLKGFQIYQNYLCALIEATENESTKLRNIYVSLYLYMSFYVYKGLGHKQLLLKHVWSSYTIMA